MSDSTLTLPATTPLGVQVRRVALSDRAKLGLVLLVTMAQALIFLAIVPPWQHYDEPTHFEHAWLIANRGRLAVPGDNDPVMQREVFSSMQAHDFFGDSTPPNWLESDETVWLGISELDHPPAYYSYLSIPLSFVTFLDMTSQLQIARLFSAVLFLGIILLVYATVAELTPVGHALRWLVPLCLSLIGPFANQMTAVNNDVASVFTLTLFLYLAVRLIRRPFAWLTLVLLVGAAVLALFSKNTTAFGVGLLPLILVIAAWVKRRWSWGWLVGGAVLVAVGTGMLFFSGSDAAYWYRNEWGDIQLGATRAQLNGDIPYDTAIRITKAPSVEVAREWMNPLLAEQVRELRGKTVTTGGWIWADQPLAITRPGLMTSPTGSDQIINPSGKLNVTTTPTFFQTTTVVPTDTGLIYYALLVGPYDETPLQPVNIYLQGAFIIEGEIEVDAAALNANPTPLPDEIMGRNLLRNPSGEQSWPRVRYAVVAQLRQYLRRSPTFIANAIFDVERSVPFMTRTVAPYLLRDLFTAYGWGHVRVLGDGWMTAFSALVGASTIGGLVWWLRGWNRRSPTLSPALAVLGLTAAGVYISALVWPLIYPWAKWTLPSARYAFPAIMPVMLLLVGGWLALWPVRWRVMGIGLLVGFFAIINIVGIWTVYQYYHA